MIEKLNLKDKKTAEEVRNLQMASYSIEAELIGCYEIPPLKDTVESLISCDEHFYGYKEGETLAGIISYKREGDTLDIHRVAIHPDFFRRGIANEMIDFIEEVEPSITRIIVSTGSKNLPAVKLYEKKGFVSTGEVEVAEGVFITEFEKGINQ